MYYYYCTSKFSRILMRLEDDDCIKLLCIPLWLIVISFLPWFISYMQYILLQSKFSCSDSNDYTELILEYHVLHYYQG